MLAAAFGTEAFLKGCSNEVQTEINAHVLVHFVIAICLMTIMERIISSGRPSELAYEEYVQALKHCHDSLKGLFTSGEGDTRLDATNLNSLNELIARVETFASEAAHEQRCWRRPFPVALFSHLTSFASWMRGQLVCIQTVAYAEDRSVDSSLRRQGSSGLHVGAKKGWFKNILEDEIWRSQIDGLVEEIWETLNMVIELQEENKHHEGSLPWVRSVRTASYQPLGGPQHVAPRQSQTAADIEQHVLRHSLRHSVAPVDRGTRRNRTAADMEQHLIQRTQSKTVGADHLSKDEDVQQAFVAGCLESIKLRNNALKVEITRNLQTERGAAPERDSDHEGDDAERIRAPLRTHRVAPQLGML